MRICGMTDTGVKRENNQDLFDYTVFADGVGCAVVCDGMGGANAGETASMVAVESVMGILNEVCGAGAKDSEIRRALQNAVVKANADIVSLAESDPDRFKGMGTTMAAAVVNGRVLHISHIGDSRIYSFMSGVLTRLTKDHSLVNDMVDTGEITRDQAMVHPSRNIITRALGVAKTVLEDYRCLVMRPGEIVLICTDGLYNFVDDEKIASIIEKYRFENLPAKMIEAANEQGGGDNITAVVMKSEV